VPAGIGNLGVGNLAFLDSYHISTVSACRGVGSAAYAYGYDLDDEPWSNPPSMGCDEVVPANLVGPLSISCSASDTNALVNHYDFFWSAIQGRAAYVNWSFGDSEVYTNFGSSSSHLWTNSGDFPVTVTVFNNDNPGGVCASLWVHVEPLLPTQIQTPSLQTNGFWFQFATQTNATYTIQYSTNLSPPVTWQTLQTIYYNNQTTIQVLDPASTNESRFYRVLTQ
jgi:hypothetical protein